MAPWKTAIANVDNNNDNNRNDDNNKFWKFPDLKLIWDQDCSWYAFVVLLTGMFAIRSERDYVVQEDFMKAVRKVAENKKLESKLDYKPV